MYVPLAVAASSIATSSGCSAFNRVQSLDSGSSSYLKHSSIKGDIVVFWLYGGLFISQTQIYLMDPVLKSTLQADWSSPRRSAPCARSLSL